MAVEKEDLEHFVFKLALNMNIFTPEELGELLTWCKTSHYPDKSFEEGVVAGLAYLAGFEEAFDLIDVGEDQP